MNYTAQAWERRCETSEHDHAGRLLFVGHHLGGFDAAARARDMPAEWAERAEALADWAMKSLVNRMDRYGAYHPLGERKGRSKSYTAWRLGRKHLVRHFIGADVGHVLGLHTTVLDAGGVCRSRWLAIDIDRHDESGDQDANERYARLLYERAAGLGLKPLLVDSNGRGGFHLWIVFAEPADTADVYDFGRWLTRDRAEYGFDNKQPEVFPKQKSVGWNPRHPGSWLRLPGRHHTRDHWSRVWDGGRWLEGHDAIGAVLATTGVPSALIPRHEMRQAEVERAVSKSDGDLMGQLADVQDQPRLDDDHLVVPVPARSPRAALYTGARQGDPMVMANEAIHDHPIERTGTRHNVHDTLIARLLGLDYPPELVIAVVMRHYDYYQADGVINSPRDVARSEARDMIANKLGSDRFTPYIRQFDAAIVGVKPTDDQLAIMRDRTIFPGRRRHRGKRDEGYETEGENPGGGGEPETNKHTNSFRWYLSSRPLYECRSGLRLSDCDPLCRTRGEFAFVDAILAIVTWKRSLGEQPVKMYDKQIARIAQARGIASLTVHQVGRLKERYVRRINVRRAPVPAKFRELLAEVYKGNKNPTTESAGRPSEYDVTGLDHLLKLAPPVPTLLFPTGSGRRLGLPYPSEFVDPVPAARARSLP